MLLQLFTQTSKEINRKEEYHLFINLPNRALQLTLYMHHNAPQNGLEDIWPQKRANSHHCSLKKWSVTENSTRDGPWKQYILSCLTGVLGKEGQGEGEIIRYQEPLTISQVTWTWANWNMSTDCGLTFSEVN